MYCAWGHPWSARERHGRMGQCGLCGNGCIVTTLSAAYMARVKPSLVQLSLYLQSPHHSFFSRRRREVGQSTLTAPLHIFSWIKNPTFFTGLFGTGSQLGGDGSRSLPTIALLASCRSKRSLGVQATVVPRVTGSAQATSSWPLGRSRPSQSSEKKKGV